MDRLPAAGVKRLFPSGQNYQQLSSNAQAGVETRILDGVSLRIYSPAKTIADCFKYRNKIGAGVAVEGLRTLKERGELDPAEVLHYAGICRVEAVMRPYLQALA